MIVEPILGTFKRTLGTFRYLYYVSMGFHNTWPLCRLRAVLDLIQPVLTLQSRILDNGIQVSHDSLMPLGEEMSFEAVSVDHHGHGGLIF